MDRKSQIINEVLSAVSHGIGVGLSIAGLVFLIIKGMAANSGQALFAYLVYGISLLGLYSFSMLFHSLYFTRARRLFQIFDHCGIFLLIAGTYTPYCLLAIKGSLGLGLLIIIWLLAIFGIIYHILAKKRLQWIETLTFVIMGWLCLVGARPLAQALGSHGLTLLVFGGIVFTLGALVYSIKGVKYAHVYWHFFVMLGSLLMFFSIYYYI